MSDIKFSGHITPHMPKTLEFPPSDLVISVKARVTFSSTVAVSGGTDNEALAWEIGFTQTVLESKRQATYIDSQNRECFIRVDEMIGLPSLDVLNSTTPDAAFRAFYTDPTIPKASNSSVFVTMTDTPLWGSLPRTKNQVGRLRDLTGRDRFCTWLIAHRKAVPGSADKVGEIRYLAWVTWQVNFDTVMNLGWNIPDHGKSQGARLTGHGTGNTPSPVKPVLTGTTKDVEAWYSVMGGRRTLLTAWP
jgi:hypothetical protein